MEFNISLENHNSHHGNNIKRIDPLNPVVVWTEDNIEFNLSPVLVCRKPMKTVGLGDAISAVGLLYQDYK